MNSLDEFLPPQWRKSKNIEADIWKEHKKFVGMSDKQAKHRYLQSVRSLKWYGVTFFVVREKPKAGNKKLQKVLLGITRDKIIKADPKTTVHHLSLSSFVSSLFDFITMR
jgi:hypothetical protein